MIILSYNLYKMGINMNINKNNIIKISIVTVVTIAILIIAYISFNIYNNRRIESTYSDIEEYLNIDMANIEAEQIDYYIEKKDVAVANYEKSEMNYTLKSSINPKKNLVDTNHNWGPNILMYCDVSDNEQVQVISCLDENNLSVMKAEWNDNGQYYSMYTDNLTTREDFLLEVNKVVIESHIKNK